MNRRMAVCVMSASIAIASAAALVAKDRLDMRLRDDCDPATFNAAVGPGTCVGGGDTTFQAFLAEFTATGQVEKWRLSDDHPGVDRGTPVSLTNRGGEVHTFTRVAEFGGGFIPILNGRPDGTTLTPAPECAVADGVPQPPSADNIFVPAGTTVAGPTLKSRGTVRFQCCIHPWMHTEVTVK